MTIQNLLQSGIPERYALGIAEAGEVLIIEPWLAHPEIIQRIDRLQLAVEQSTSNHTQLPRQGFKEKLLLELYQTEAANDSKWPPLIKGKETIPHLEKWQRSQYYPIAAGEYDNLFPVALPCSPAVENFYVFAKKGHEEECHTTHREFLFLLEGACIMYFEEQPEQFGAGSLIQIPPGIAHRGVVISSTPMLALVQRQVWQPAITSSPG
jgi:quercetin dioxygenase-like cupin family protein